MVKVPAEKAQMWATRSPQQQATIRSTVRPRLLIYTAAVNVHVSFLHGSQSISLYEFISMLSDKHTPH